MDIGTLATGAVGGIALKELFDWRRERRFARRIIYTEILTLLQVRKAATYRLANQMSVEPPPDIEEERIGRLNALAAVDGSKRVRDLLDECYRTMQMFWNSYTMRAPISVDEHGLFSYDLKLMATNPAGGEIAWRMCLGNLDTKFGRNVDALAARVRRELHGPFTA